MVDEVWKDSSQDMKALKIIQQKQSQKIGEIGFEKS